MIQLKFVPLGLCAFSLVLSITSLALPYWVDEGLANFGLWSTCFSLLFASTCDSWTETPNTLMAVRAMAILGMVGLIASLVCGVLYTFVMKDKKLLKMMFAIAAFTAGGFLIIGAIIFAANRGEKIDPSFTRNPGKLDASDAIIKGASNVIKGVIGIGKQVKPPNDQGTLHAGFAAAILAGLLAIATGGVIIKVTSD